MKATKVFCIGFQKTGTSSMAMALETLGYRVTSYFPFRDLAQRPDVNWELLTERAIALAHEYDAAKDTPWPLLYRELDEAFPGSKFIHVVRDRDKWLQSAVNDFANHPNEIHRLIYGSPFPAGNEQAWLERYDRHNREVVEYFAGRGDDFVSLDMTAGEVSWEPICRFLGEPVPNKPWPHANTRRAKRFKLLYWRARDRVRSVLGLGGG